MIAAQARGEDMKKWVDRWKSFFDLDDQEATDMKRFLSDMNQGD